MGFYDIEFSNCYQLTLHQTFATQLVLNRFFYQTNGPYTDELIEAAENLSDALVPVIGNLQHESLDYDWAVLLELFGDRQQALFPFMTTTGLLSGNPLPAFFGSRYRLTCTDSRVRKGRKIFAAPTEDMVTLDTMSGTYTAENAALCTALETPIVLGDFTWTPVLLSPANTRHTGNLIVPIYHAGWAGWSTQGSRKVGRGA